MLQEKKKKSQKVSKLYCYRATTSRNEIMV